MIFVTFDDHHYQCKLVNSINVHCNQNSAKKFSLMKHDTLSKFAFYLIRNVEKLNIRCEFTFEGTQS